MKDDIIEKIVLPEGTTAELKEGILIIKGSKGEVQKTFRHPKITLELQSNDVVVKALRGTKREKKNIGSFASHIRNMVHGVNELYTYTLKICSGHFPMSVSVSGQELTVKNFLGESVPRKVVLLPGAEVKVDGDVITIKSPDKEIAGQNAAKIENLCRITNKDRRIFQDGCYIIQKAGKNI